MKSILIIDTPEDFDYKRCRIGGDGNIYYERKCEHRPQRASIIGNIKNLKPMPQAKQVFFGSEREIWKNAGWNECVNEILGGEE